VLGRASPGRNVATCNDSALDCPVQLNQNRTDNNKENKMYPIEQLSEWDDDGTMVDNVELLTQEVQQCHVL
jgi:hypothetical protein